VVDNVSFGSAIGTTAFPANPSRTGYDFTGWNTKEDGTGTAFTPETVVTANTTVYAQWTAKAYTVTFTRNQDGSDSTVLAAKTVSYPNTSDGGFPANPSRTGYTFTGWNTRAAGTGTAFTSETTVNADIRVYAQWTAKTYTVSFMRNQTGSDGAVLAAKTVTVPATEIGGNAFPANPAWTGHVFKGWNLARDGTGSPFTAATVINADMTVYAQWTLGTDYVTFRLNDGTQNTIVVDNVSFGSAIGTAAFPANPSRTGYDFAGWNTRADGTGTAFSSATVVTANTTVYAQWTARTYTVSFDRNGGDTAADPAGKTVTVPNPLGDLPAPPTRTGYDFTGWNTRADGTGTAVTSETAVTANTTVYAQWRVRIYTVTFMRNWNGTDATLYAAKPVSYPNSYDGGFPGVPSHFMSSDYEFSGWNTQAGGGGTAFSSTSPVSANIMVYAQWRAKVYTVSFDKNGGDTDASPASKTLTAPGPVGALPADPRRTGYAFAGWNTRADGTGTELSVETAVHADMTAYARWTAEMDTVMFVLNDGTGLVHDFEMAAFGNAIGEADFPDNPGRTGYTFAGWNTQADGTGDTFTASTVVSANITVHAQWITETDTVMFALNDGTAAFWDFELVTFGSAIGAADFPEDPGRTGYTFAGWKTAADGSGTAFTSSTVVSASITVYAQWTAKTYTVGFVRNWNENDTAPYITKTVTYPNTYSGGFPANPSHQMSAFYNFNGWNTQANGSGTAFTGETAVSADMTVYAQYVGISRTVSFDKNGGTTEADPKTKTITAGPVGDLPAPPTRANYDFMGWNTQADGTGTAVDGTYMVVYGDIRVYAQWTPVPIAGGGTVAFVPVEGDPSQLWEIHSFTESGTFTYTGSSLTVDYLIVAGGGGTGGDAIGTSDYSGGGGAGGLLYRTGQTLTLTNNAVTITVGAGGAGGATTQANGANGGKSAIGATEVPGGGYGAGGNGVGNSGVVRNGGNGGSGGGGNSAAFYTYGTGGTSTATGDILGHKGGNGAGGNTDDGGGSGGGAASAGTNGRSDGKAVAGGLPWTVPAGASWFTTATCTTEFSRGGNGGGIDAPDGGRAGVNYGDGGSGGKTGKPGAAGHSGIVVIGFKRDS
jgi:uncharacterized repeat protein (TIGR02543 family)